MDRKIYISVILPLKLEWEPCYWTDIGDIAVGQRVRVLFAGKEYTGTVSATGIEPLVAPSKIQQVISIEGRMAKILPEEIRFWRTLAGYYMCTVGEVYKSAYPARKICSEEILAKREEVRMAREERMKTRLEEKRVRLNIRLEKKLQLLDKCKNESRKTAIISVAGELERQIRDVDMALQAISKARINAETDGTEETEETAPALTDGHSDAVCGERIVLSSLQRQAVDRIRNAFRHGKTVLLHGVTGSGKTEIYISLAAETLRKGRNVLYLVPEKAMERQLEERLRRYFGTRLLVFHSGETAARKAGTAERIRSSADAGYIVLGTRSAVFLPHHNLGLVVVDEEHDSSYKQDSPAPRYNGRDAAIMLGSLQLQNTDNASGKADRQPGCNVILGSATPSLESLYNCRTGKFTEVRLDSRYYGDGGTEVEIIDTAAERRKNGMKGTFSIKLIGRIRTALAEGGKVMLLRTRRGYSPVLQCSECGYIPKCPGCNVSLTYHKDSGRTVCHHCGYSILRPESCPECGGAFKGLGAGTQKIEEEVSGLFPDARVARLDSDSARSRSYVLEILSKLSRGEIDILIGTQIVTKGFDFGNISLVAVLQADTLLGIQDFRADERAMQTLMQFKGRCGRRGGRSLFVIQTAQPGHPVYRMLTDGENGNTSEEYVSGLLSEREEFGYPPYTRIIDIIIRDRNEERAGRMGRLLAGTLSDFNVTGPYIPAEGKLANEYIRCIRITLDKDRRLAGRKIRLQEAISRFESCRNYSGHITLNVDPA